MTRFEGRRFWLLAGLLALSAYFWNLGSYGLIGVAQRKNEEHLTSDLGRTPVQLGETPAHVLFANF